MSLLGFNKSWRANSKSLFDYIEENEWNEVIERLQTHPDDAAVTDGDGNLPLNWACCYKAPHKVLEKLIRLNPDAAHVKNSHGQYPLNYLLYRGKHGAPSLESVKLLIDANPAALKNKDNDDDLPLHEACRNMDIRSNVLREMIIAHPEAIFSENSRGATPFDQAELCGIEFKFQKACVESKILDAAMPFLIAKSELEKATRRIEDLQKFKVSALLQKNETLEREKKEVQSKLQVTEALLEKEQAKVTSYERVKDDLKIVAEELATFDSVKKESAQAIEAIQNLLDFEKNVSSTLLNRNKQLQEDNDRLHRELQNSRLRVLPFESKINSKQMDKLASLLSRGPAALIFLVLLAISQGVIVLCVT